MILDRRFNQQDTCLYKLLASEKQPFSNSLAFYPFKSGLKNNISPVQLVCMSLTLTANSVVYNWSKMKMVRPKLVCLGMLFNVCKLWIINFRQPCHDINMANINSNILKRNHLRISNVYLLTSLLLICSPILSSSYINIICKVFRLRQAGKKYKQ